MTTDSSKVESEEAKAAAEAEAAQKADAKPENSAGSSDAGEQGGAKEPKSVLEAVTAALKGEAKKDEAEQSPSSKEGSEDGDASKKESEKAKGAEPEEDEDEEEPPFHTHPRWKKMKEQRDTARSQVQELTAKTEELNTQLTQQKEVVDRFNGFTQAVQQAGLNSQEVNTGFEIMRLMKADPMKAYEMLTPYFEALSLYAGDKLPADLQERVDKGAIDLETAKELAQARSQRVFSTQRERENQARSTQQEQQRKLTEHVNSVANAITGWENDWKKNDPDYQKKHSLVSDKILALMSTQGYPKTAKAAVELANKAKQEVEKQLASVMPQRKEKRPPTGGSSGNGATPEPKNMQEAIMQGLRRTAA